MGVYDGQIARAQAKIKAKGQAVQWVKPDTAAAPADTNKPWNAAQGNPTSYNVYIAFFPQKGAVYDKGADTITSYLFGLMGAVPFAPDAGDHVIRNGVSLAIAGIKTLAPNGDAILYTVDFIE